MHGLDGFRFRELQRAHPRLADIPTLVMSGRPVVPEEKMRLRANEYVWKPVRIAELRALVSEHARPIPNAHPGSSRAIGLGRGDRAATWAQRDAISPAGFRR